MFNPTVKRRANGRSLMNVCFVTGDAEKDAAFLDFSGSSGA